MAFVNEYIPVSDQEKFHLKEIDQQVGINRRTNSDDWTIDRERNMYLRCVAQGREEFAHESAWTFFWHGELIWVEIEMLGGSSSGRNVPGWAKKRISKLCLMGGGCNYLPAEFASKRNQILSDLQVALLAYKDGGVYSSTTTYELMLDFAEGV